MGEKHAISLTMRQRKLEWEKCSSVSPSPSHHFCSPVAGTAELNPNPSANNFYYEKTCLPGVNAHEACTYRSFSFERIRKTALEGFVKKSIQVRKGEGMEGFLNNCLFLSRWPAGSNAWVPA
jgi:hypothetical protein